MMEEDKEEKANRKKLQNGGKTGNGSSKVSWRNKLWKKNEQIDNNQSSSSSSSSDTSTEMEPKIRLEDTRAGMKISRFYDWGLANPRAQAAIAEMREKGSEWNSLRPPSGSDSNSNSKSETNDIMNKSKASKPSKSAPAPTSAPPTSSKEKNIGCARETHALWACRALALGCAADLASLKKCFVHKLGTTNPGELHYDSGGGSVTTSGCGLEQKKIRDCVLKNWTELKERTERRQ